jgi:hypothetical protein
MIKTEILINAFEAMQSNGKMSDGDFRNSFAAEIGLLTSRLNLPEEEVMILAACFGNVFDGMKLAEIGNFLGWSPVNMFRNERHLNNLMKRNYLHCVKNKFHDNSVRYVLTLAAREAIRNDKALQNIDMENHTEAKNMPLFDRFNAVAKYINKFEVFTPTIESFSEDMLNQVNAIKASTQLSDNEIIILAKIISRSNRRNDGENANSTDLFCNYEEKIFFQPAVRSLIAKRYIYSTSNKGNDYRAMPFILDQMKNGEKLDFALTFANNEELFDCLLREFKMGRAFGRYNEEFISNGSYRVCSEMVEDFASIVANNRHLAICREIANMNLCNYELATLFFLCYTYVMEDNDVVSKQYLLSALQSNSSEEIIASRFIRQMIIGKSVLISGGWVDFAGEGINRGDSFTLTRKSLDTLLGDCKFLSNNLSNDKHVKLPESFAAKPMFYNERESGEVARLVELLKPDAFNSVKQRLAAQGERQGFVCLFYGGPGTGKTETVQQIARLTGRAVYQVNISEINSKWVGDTEKNIKRVFDRYHDYAKKCTVEPILFFNEADAIFTRRVEISSTSANAPVAQMQNAVQNIILQEMETLEGIMIATTNLTQNLDPAMERRILYKIRFDKPETNVKMQLWQSFIPALTAEEAHALALRYDFSGGQIENVKRKSIVDNILTGEIIGFDRICEYCSHEKLDSGRPKIGF